MRPDLDPRMAQMLVLGALNWTAEWWDPRRASVDAIVSDAQTLIRGAPKTQCARGTETSVSHQMRPRRPAGELADLFDSMLN